jgi:hypothetical protein
LDAWFDDNALSHVYLVSCRSLPGQISIRLSLLSTVCTAACLASSEMHPAIPCFNLPPLTRFKTSTFITYVSLRFFDVTGIEMIAVIWHDGKLNFKN